MTDFHRFWALVAFVLLISSCSSPEPARMAVSSEFSEYVSGHTSGKISTEGEIAVTLAQKVEESRQQTSGLFKLEPDVSGETRWVNNTTVVFKPEKPLKNGQDYQVSFALDKFFELDDKKAVFAFPFSTIKQDMEIEFEGIETTAGNRNMQQLSGAIYTADAAKLQDVERILKAEQSGNDLEVKWTQDGRQRTHQFQISGIQRKEEASKLTVAWDGAAIDASSKNKRTFEIVPAGAFELMDVMVFRDQNPRAELTFSDPLNPSQNLEGLVRIGNSGRLNFIINGNKLIINPRQRTQGTQTLTVSDGIKNVEGKRLGTEFTRQLQFFQPKPQVQLLGKGTIIPRSSDLLFPFKAVSLGAVDVRVTRIFESNIGQFFQDNQMNGSNRWSINKVGRAVHSGVVPLSKLGNVDAGEWNNYALDLAKLIEPAPGAIYMVELGFRPHQAVYPCGESEISDTDLADRDWELNPEEEKKYWDNYGSSNYPVDYDWRERENPCSSSYYTNQLRKSRNVFTSDLGVIAKKADNNNTIVFITDLLTTEPKSGVKVEAYDYQQQPIVAGSSDANGMVSLETSRKPFYLVASLDDQKGYLKMDDGNALSVSDFDVSGAAVAKGLKGFLYGERGVWRPGDSLFVTLILEDKNNVLPVDHPVTFELKNPSGQTADRQTFNAGVNGVYVYTTQTDPQAPTGNWLLSVQAGGVTFEKTLKVESVKPNRLKIDVDFENEQVTLPSRELKAELSSQWLHGATAKNLKADVEMGLSPSVPSFSGFPGYSFSDASVSFSSQPEPIFEGNLNENGITNFTHRFTPMSEGPARVQVNLRSRVYEPSGNFSIGQASTYYYPFRTIIGIKSPGADEDKYGTWLDRDKPQEFEVASVDFEGNPVGNKELDVEVYQIRWRWWWERGREDLSSYFERENVQRVFSGKARTGRNGTGSFSLELPERSRGGRYMVRVKDRMGGHSASSVVYFSWYGGRSESVSPARLTFESDKEKYEVDEQITLTIPSSEGSNILVSLESGSKVLNTTWITGKDGETEFSFTAHETMAPNFYAHVMHIQPHGQETNDLPIRMYGVIPISIEDSQTRLHPVVNVPEEIRPETSAEIDVSEEDGKAMTYTIAMVDEGLLDLTNFKTPVPHDHFYAREALGVKTWDMFEFVSTAYGENLSRILSIGGDGAESEIDPLTEANRFEPMVRFEGPFELGKGAVNRHKISVPNYVGSVRTMIIASQDGAYGQTEAATPVRKPVMVQATLPRVLGPGETVSLPVSVFAMKDGIRNVQLRVETNEIFELQGEDAATLHFDEPGDQLFIFRLKTKSLIGVGKIRVEAASGSETAYHEIEIAVRNPNTPYVDVKQGIAGEGETWKTSFQPQGMAGTNTAMLEVSRIPPIDFGKRLKYLLRYPHGCVEQTVSSVFPQLYLGRLMELSDERKAGIQQNIDEAIKRLEKFITFSGGLAYWPGNEDSDAWGTNYGYHFLLEARKLGYYVPSDLMDRINRFQQQRARNWSENNDYRRSDLIQAYRLYTLAEANSPELGAMNRLREMSNLSKQAKWRLAATYAIAGQKEAANDLLTGVSTEVEDYRELSRSYGSTLRDRSMILETLSILNREHEAALIARDIATELSSQQWLSTQTTAYSLIAISRFLEEFNAAEEMKAGFSVNGERAGTIDSRAVIVQIPITIDEYAENTFELLNESEGSLYTRLILEGTPLLGDSISTSNSLVQKIRFTNLGGESIDPEKLEQGTDFVAEVTVSNPGLRGDYEELALTQIFPSGWEIRNTRMDDESFDEPNSSFSYQDIRDDRVYTYFDLAPNKSKTYRVQLNAGYAGSFYMPAIKTSAMYDETISARSAGKWIEVTGVE